MRKIPWLPASRLFPEISASCISTLLKSAMPDLIRSFRIRKVLTPAGTKTGRGAPLLIHTDHYLTRVLMALAFPLRQTGERYGRGEQTIFSPRDQTPCRSLSARSLRERSCMCRLLMQTTENWDTFPFPPILRFRRE